MVRRQSKIYREDEILLSQEVPFLSDDVSLPMDQQRPSSVGRGGGKSKKGGWRSRLFGGSNGGTSVAVATVTPPRSRPTSVGRSRSAQRGTNQQQQQQREHHHTESNVAPHRPPHQRAVAVAVPDLAYASSSSSSQNNEDARYSAPLRWRHPEAAGTKVSVRSASELPPERAAHQARATTTTNQLGASQPRSMPPPVPDARVVQALRRPFGRESVRREDQLWIVVVSPAEWDGDDSLWKHRINIQRRIQSGQEEILQDLTHGMTLRSIADFWWLEQALQTEFHGALLIPSLSIALGVPDLGNCQLEVDAILLTNWLSDVMNGIRGQGEWRLNRATPVSWQTCEAMEAFMYRADLHQSVDAIHNPADNLNWEDGQGGLLRWITQGDMCGLTVCVKQSDSQPQILSPSKTRKINFPLNKQTVSSKALGDARTLNVQDSFVDPAVALENMSRRNPAAQYTELLQAERELIWNWRMRALSVMEKLRILQNEERNVAGGWKRFAISICNLFAYEKEVESARLGDSKSRKDVQMPYRKLQKSTVDDVLRIMAKQKMDRFTPGLDQLSIMIAAYVADLSSVQPAIDAYLEGLNQLAMQSEMMDMLTLKDVSSGIQASSSTLKNQIQAGLHQVKKQLVLSGDGSAGGTELLQAKTQLEIMELRVKDNEELFEEHLTRLCKTGPVRCARMAYRYLQTEMRQAGALHGSALNTKARINVVSNDALSKMIQRHSIERKEDREIELQLVQRMVNLGNSKRFLKVEDGTEEVERGVEINKESMYGKGELRDKAIELCRGRVGRWDSKVAMAIMEAVGVDDANVRVEETTRELRLVRKLAIGLREHVERCIEALEGLRLSIWQGTSGDVRRLRREMMLDLQTLLSGAYKPMEEPASPLNIQALYDKGISCNDPMGWRRQQGGCGGAVMTYMDERDAGVDWLLNSFADLLKEYYHRVESVECFVYMECVGIQLEKHFSQRRAAALAAFEKKTDITSAINIATRKRMPEMVKELQAKLEAVGTDVSHTTVKEAKEAHLESKALKQELHDLSMRQLTRTKETSTERAIALMAFWSKEDESSASSDLQRLKDLSLTLELSCSSAELIPYLEAVA